MASSAVCSGRSILLVDDQFVVRHLAERALTRAGWTVLSADSAEAALALVEHTDPTLGLLISDVIMPGLDGPTLASRLRRRWPDLPVLLVSGYLDDRVRLLLQETGFAFLPKPYRLTELTERAALLVG